MRRGIAERLHKNMKEPPDHREKMIGRLFGYNRRDDLNFLVFGNINRECVIAL